MDENQENNMDKIVATNIEEEMKESYIEYAMSVIVSRALPDVRDGLKPVHRRILYAMNELNLEPSKPYKKSARIVGDTMGKYHPHGDSSIYDAMVRMAQEFSTRYMLVDGQGNFGSMDGDSAAAQRYTEARLSKISMQMLADIDKDSVDFAPNYNEEFLEPTVLPARFPALLVNGSNGIAVGMATNIPPHNLTEAVEAILKIIDNEIEEGRETEIEELLAIVKGPDFPTGATILGTNGIKMAYRTGRGKIKVRARATIESKEGGRERIVVTELPYQVNKARLVEKIAELVKDKRVDGISDITDESDRHGVRVVVEIKRDGNASVVLNQLYKYTQLQESFGVIMLALVNNEPRIMNLKEMLNHYLEHQKEVVTRRTLFDLKKAKKREHLLEGYFKALDNIDEVLEIIRGSSNTAEAKEKLAERFELSEEQTSAIVEMRFRSLTGMERGKLEEEYGELRKLIEELEGILADKKILLELIRKELEEVKDKFGDRRRTELMIDEGEIEIEDLIEEEMSVITLSHLDYIKRIPLDTYKSQNRGGRGVIGMQMRDEDIVKNVFVASTHDHLLFFTSLGRVFRKKAFEIPEAGRTAKGLAIVNLLNLDKEEKIREVVSVREFVDEEYLVMVTKRGIAKKTPLSQFGNIKNSGLRALNFKEGINGENSDELISVFRTDGAKEIFVATKEGKGLRFKEEEIRSMGRTATGVRIIRLSEEDEVVGADYLEDGNKILFVSSKGFGKCTETEEFSLRHRGGKGLKIYRITDRTGRVVGVCRANDKEELMLINSEGVIIRIRIGDISTQGRVTQGVKLINLQDGSEVVNIAKILEDINTAEETETEETETEAETEAAETAETETEESLI